MKFVVEKNSFLRLLIGTYGVASKKNPGNLAILQNVKIEASEGLLYLTGTDSDTYIKNHGEANVETDGVTTVSAQLLYEIVRKMEDGSEISCSYSTNDKILSVGSGRSRFKLMCMDAGNYPNFEDQQIQSKFQLKLKDLMTMIDKTRFSISDDLSRYYLNGLFLHTIEDDRGRKLVATSTDSHRLSVVELSYYDGNEPLAGVIVPKKALPEIKKIVSMSDQEEIQVSVSKTKIKFETDNSLIISKLIDAEFPDYRRVVPRENNRLMRVNRKEITSVIDRVSTVTSDSHRGIKFILSENNLLLEAHSNENGSASEEIKVDFNYPEKIEVGFNSKFVLDIFSQIDSETVNIFFKDSASAILVEDRGETTNNTFVLMPIRI
ncbi:MAG: DNA polymerase III subunit beta [Rickettsiales bacterium]|jgi:DNA polymerase-3 subunit beta|nr:DNA polymerase III subunit beta [Rickettsiales bacterium]